MTGSDTIFALSSGAGRAGIAVLRISGPLSTTALSKLVDGIPEPRRVAYRDVFDPVTGEIIDKGLVVWFQGPKSATGEDLVELHLHGSSAVVERALGALASIEGLGLAEAGEFSRRAFRNGKMDLVEAEGLADLLAAEGEVQRRQALFHMTGAASDVFNNWLQEASAILARLEAAIDFIDEADIATSALDGVRQRIAALTGTMERALQASARADAVREGVRIVIIGAPNVGKSSILNRLAARDAAIVSSVPGTTRDVIEVRLMLGGLSVIVSDTAGLRRASGDEIENTGMERARQAASSAHLVIQVGAPDVAEEPLGLPESLPSILVYNKADLPGTDSIQTRNDKIFAVSARTGQGFDQFLQALEERVRYEYARNDSPVVVRERHRIALRNSIRLLNESLTFKPDQIELAAEAVRGAAHSLARITGRVDVEDLLGRIFSEFCVGK
jgi:tRNA modification GTPase